jgi:hypothetical protein
MKNTFKTLMEKLEMKAMAGTLDVSSMIISKLVSIRKCGSAN